MCTTPRRRERGARRAPRRLLVASCLCALLLTTACGSLQNFLFQFPGTPFGGVGQDMDWIVSVNPFVILFGIIDLPFSLILDILLLPIQGIFG